MAVVPVSQTRQTVPGGLERLRPTNGMLREETRNFDSSSMHNRARSCLMNHGRDGRNEKNERLNQTANAHQPIRVIRLMRGSFS